MAELAIPLVALGCLYVASNQEKQEKQESFENLANTENNILPKSYPHKLPVNYPVANTKENSVMSYANPNNTLDKYYDNNVHEKIMIEKNSKNELPIENVQSLTGETINKSDFRHNNMQPFFGAKIKGATSDPNIAETILDNKQGGGSQLFKKQATAPLFSPQENMQWNTGMPNVNDFMQNRVNPSMKMSNIKPWDEQRVAPGLGKGFSTMGGNGFNSGTEAREDWMPKNVDQLRVKTNPKMTFEMQGHEGPAHSYVQNSATKETQGAVEKYLPDKYYASGPERWLTTTGIEKAATGRAIEVMPDVNRPDTTVSYFGSGMQEGKATYADSNYEESKRKEVETHGFANCSAIGQHNTTENDYNIKGYNSLPNNRSTTVDNNNFGFVNGVMKAMVAPVVDMLRPSRKENVIGSIRPSGNVNGGQKMQPVINPANRARTTHRETYVDALDCNHLNVEKQTSTAYQMANPVAGPNQRDTTSTYYIGDPEGATQMPTYNAAYNQRNNNNKSSFNRPNQGGTQIFNQRDNISIKKLDADRRNNRGNISVGGPHFSSSVETYGEIGMPQTYNEGSIQSRISPDILNAFKQNPYTQSLNSFA